MSFANLKKQSRLGSLTSKLTNEIEKMNKGSTGGADERLWKLEVDKAGNGYAVIRFLPAPNGEELPWAKVWSHAFFGQNIDFLKRCTFFKKTAVFEGEGGVRNLYVTFSKRVLTCFLFSDGSKGTLPVVGMKDGCPCKKSARFVKRRPR